MLIAKQVNRPKISTFVLDVIISVVNFQKPILPVHEAISRFEKTTLKNKEKFIEACLNGNAEGKEYCERKYNKIVRECLSEITRNYKYITTRRYYRIYCEFLKKTVKIRTSSVA